MAGNLTTHGSELELQKLGRFFTSCLEKKYFRVIIVTGGPKDRALFNNVAKAQELLNPRSFLNNKNDGKPKPTVMIAQSGYNDKFKCGNHVVSFNYITAADIFNNPARASQAAESTILITDQMPLTIRDTAPLADHIEFGVRYNTNADRNKTKMCHHGSAKLLTCLETWMTSQSLLLPQYICCPGPAGQFGATRVSLAAEEEEEKDDFISGRESMTTKPKTTVLNVTPFYSDDKNWAPIILQFFDAK